MKAIINNKLKRLTKKEIQNLQDEEARLRKSQNGTYTTYQ